MPHVDYLSFTFTPSPRAYEYAAQDIVDRAVVLLATELGEQWCNYYLGNTEFRSVTPMRPYSWAAAHEETGLEVHYHPLLNHAYIRLPGRTCHRLQEAGGGVETLAVARADRVTRIDIAHDFYTALRPKEVTDAGYSKRIKSFSHVVSDTGETVYLGSRQSERFVRIYRYNEPSPRAATLRIEIEYKGERAKALAAALERGIEDVYWAEYGNLEIAHPALEAASQGERSAISVPRLPAKEAGTYKWLVEVALPSIRRAIATGVIEKTVVMEYIEHSYSDIPF